MEMRIYHEKGMQVFAETGGLTIKTDQAVASGGDGEFPEPFTLFFASIGTCVGIYIYRFCQERDIPTEGIDITLSTTWSNELRKVDQVILRVSLPDEFPSKYEKTVIALANKCAVKKHIIDPPEFVIETARV